MKFRDLQTENPNHFNDRFKVIHPIYVVKTTTDRDKEIFVEKWRNGTATLLDWVKAETVNVDSINSEQLVESEAMAARKLQLYDWWLEYKVQDSLMNDFWKVIKYAPHQTVNYAIKELHVLNKFISGKMNENDSNNYKSEMSLKRDIDFVKQISQLHSGADLSNIHGDHGLNEAQALLRYKSYLEQIIKDNGIETNEKVHPDELSFENLWAGIIDLSKNIVIEYRSKKHYYDDNWYVDYEVLSVAGCPGGSSLKQKLRNLFEAGFNRLLTEIKAFDIEEQKNILDSLKHEFEQLLTIVNDGEYKEEESEYNPERHYYFKQFKEPQFKGYSDLHFVFNESSRTFLARNMKEYAVAWEEGINELIRKLEHAINNLELIQLSSIKLSDVKNVLDNVFILLSEEGARQGTAFYLSGYGIVTCDHCIRNDEGSEILKDLVIFRADKIQVKIRVDVVRSSTHIDLAILKISSESESDFLATGLDKGNSDELKQLDEIAVAGFPNYNEGDSGYYTTGRVTGSRVIGSISHVLVSNILVAGNSGGPALNSKGQVVGVVVTGADNFQTSGATEKHGLIAINALDLLP